MQINDQTSVFKKKVFIPWYDTTILCIIMIFLMIPIFLFSMIGISVAYEKIEYNEHLWVPISLAIMSGYVIIMTVIRLIGRHYQNIEKKEDNQIQL